MRFIIPVNEPEVGSENTSITCKVVDVGDVSIKVAKRKLRIVLTEWGIPVNQQKKLIKEYF